MTFDAVTELGALLCRVYGDHGKWGRRQRALLKRRRIAARLAEVRRWTTFWFMFRCAGCDDLQMAAPVYSAWECGNCEYAGRVSPGMDGLA